MKKQILLILAILCIISSCEKPVPKPENVIPRKEMVKILTESYLSNNVDARSIKNASIDIVQQNASILQNNGYDWQTFKDNYYYYMLSENDSKYITEKVRENLESLIPKKDTIQTDYDQIGSPNPKINSKAKKPITPQNNSQEIPPTNTEEKTVQ